MTATHAPGWSWRKQYAGQLAAPWPADLPAHLSGLCESNWHSDCPQAPNPPASQLGTCSCPCHQTAAHPRNLLDLIPGGAA